MKICIVLFGLLALALAEEKYTSKWDNIDLDQILKNDRLLNNYIDCVLEKGSCTPDGSELKSNEKFIYFIILLDCFFICFRGFAGRS